MFALKVMTKQYSVSIIVYSVVLLMNVSFFLQSLMFSPMLETNQVKGNN